MTRFGRNGRSEANRIRIDMRRHELRSSDCKRLFHVGVLFLGIALMGGAYASGQWLQNWEEHAKINQEMRGAL